jgi:hypothetical protein
MIQFIKFDVHNLDKQQTVISFLGDNDIDYCATSYTANKYVCYHIQYELLPIRTMCILKNYIMNCEQIENIKIQMSNDD